MSQTPPKAPKKSKSIFARTPIIVALITTAGLIIVAIIGKLSFPSPSPTPTPIPSSTSALTFTATPTPTVTPTASIVPATSPTFMDSLQDNSKGWGWDVGNASFGSCHFVPSEHYVLTAPANQGIGCYAETSPNYDNLAFQMTVTILSGLDNTGSGGSIVGVGTEFHVEIQNDSHYEMLFDVKGNWHLVIVVKGQRSILQSSLAGAHCSNPCSYFHTGYNQPNVFTIRAVGSNFDIWVNGHLLDSCSDSSFPSGQFGARLTPGTTSGSVAYSDLNVWQL